MYESFYNLSESPFRLTPDPRFYFSSSTHKRALTHLRFGFHQREGFVVITGKPGTGKTELMLHLLEGLPKERITYGKIVTSNLDANQTLQQVAAAFQIPAEGVKKGVLLKKLEDFFIQQVRENKRLVLIVDEAHKLSINSLNELQMLTNFQLSGKAALQCFLSGHDTLKLKLHDPELLHLKQRVITSTFLTPLEKQETGSYIEHRLRCVSWNDDPKFNQTAYSLIYDVTEGVPRQINALCNRILLRAFAEQKHYIDESMVSRAIDDVQSEPLAASPISQPSAPISQGLVTNDSEAFQSTFERSMQQSSVFKPALHSHDEDETLPLTPGMNFPPVNNNTNANMSSVAKHEVQSSGEPAIQATVTRRPSVMPNTSLYGSEMTDRQEDSSQEDTLDDARKFSDALNNFHQQTASAAQPRVKSSIDGPAPYFHGDRQAKSALHHNDLLYTASFTRQNQGEARRGWVAPFAYGSVAFLLIALGLSIWIYNFSADVLGVVDAKNPQDNRFVAAVKGLLMHEPTSAGDDVADNVADNVANKVADTASQTVATDKTISSNGAVVETGRDHPQKREVAEADTVTTSVNSSKITPFAEENRLKSTKGADTKDADTKDADIGAFDKSVADNNPAAEEKWDSGALGGNYLNQQVKTTTSRQQSADSSVTDLKGESVTGMADDDTHAQTTLPANSTGADERENTLIAQFDKMLEKNKVKSTNSASTAIQPTALPSDEQKIPVTGSTGKTPHEHNMETTSKHSVPPATHNSKQSNASAVTMSHGETPKNHQANHAEDNKAKFARGETDKTATKNGSARESSHAKKQAAMPSHSAATHKAETSTRLGDSPADSNESMSSEHHKPVIDSKKINEPSKAVAMINNEPSSIEVDKAKLNQLLAKLTSAYEKGNLQDLLSVLSKDVRSNDGSTRRDLKDGYRKLFNITDMRKMTITSVTWSKRDQLIHGKGEFELRVREKGADTVSSYGGIISLDVENGIEGAVITRLNYDYRN